VRRMFILVRICGSTHESIPLYRGSLTFDRPGTRTAIVTITQAKQGHFLHNPDSGIVFDVRCVSLAFVQQNNFTDSSGI
jgi:hypothetical protein